MDEPILEIDDICGIMGTDFIDENTVNTSKFALEFISDGVMNDVSQREMISIIRSLICHYDFNVRIDNDILLASALIYNKIKVAIYLLDLGCDPYSSIMKHHNLFNENGSFVSYDFVKICMDRAIQIDWLYQVTHR